MSTEAGERGLRFWMELITLRVISGPHRRLSGRDLRWLTTDLQSDTITILLFSIISGNSHSLSMPKLSAADSEWYAEQAGCT